MSSRTKIYVKVVKEVVSWVEVYADSIADAKITAKEQDSDVVYVVDAQYDEPYSDINTIR